MSDANILFGDNVEEIIQDEILNHWFSRKGVCSCKGNVGPDPYNRSMHVSQAISLRLRMEQLKSNE